MSPVPAGRDEYYIKPARSNIDLETATKLFKKYAESLAVDLSFQSFDAEISGFPGRYAPPSGEVLLARDYQGEPLGCVALRPMSLEGFCEMKRLYVMPQGRGSGVGRALVNAIIDEAERIGYNHMRLDTLPDMIGAISLYRKAGFVETAAYYETPLAGTAFMERVLKPQKALS